jgi:hypothetical protein
VLLQQMVVSSTREQRRDPRPRIAAARPIHRTLLPPRGRIS